jgi:cytochrome P450
MDIFPPPEQRLNPFSFYAQMRKSHPIIYDDKNELWGIFRYNDIQAVLADYRHFSSDVQKLADIQQGQQQGQEGQLQGVSTQTFRRSLLTSDPPHQSRLRSVSS